MISAIVLASLVNTTSPKPAATAAPFTLLVNTDKGKVVMGVPRCGKSVLDKDLSNTGNLIEECGLYFPGSIEVEVTIDGKKRYFTLGQARILVHGQK